MIFWLATMPSPALDVAVPPRATVPADISGT
jgi:hypothetical protein